MVFQYCYILPIVVLFWFPVTFAITYVVSLYSNEIQPLFPFISDTGTWSPESCFFGLMLNLGAILIGVILYIRYRQVRELFENENDFKSSMKTINIFSFYLGLLAILGIIIVGNFQETNQIIVHLLGAGMAFGIGTLYACFQTYISLNIYPKFGKRNVNILRIFFSIICCITCTTTSIFGLLGWLEYKGDIKYLPKWRNDDGGFEFRTGSSVSEWILVMTTILYLSTFSGEFRQITLSEPSIKLNDP